MPSFSILLVASLMPAVSVKITWKPEIFNETSMASRVVPASSETIATSLFANKLIKLDLPTLGSPIIAILKPFFKISP